MKIKTTQLRIFAQQRDSYDPLTFASSVVSEKGRAENYRLYLLQYILHEIPRAAQK